MLLLPSTWAAESLSDGVVQIVSGLDTSSLDASLAQGDPFAATGGFTSTLLSLARGEMSLDFTQVMEMLTAQFLSAIKGSLWRLTRLIAPAMVCALLTRLTGRSGDAGRIVCQLWVCVFLTQDLTEHIALCKGAVTRLSEGMQGLFPLLLTMMAAVGGRSGSALMQPAIMASASAMTGLIQQLTLPLATAAAILTMLCHLGEGIRLQTVKTDFL